MPAGRPAALHSSICRRLREKQEAYDNQWDNGLGSHHPDYDPSISGTGVVKASRTTGNYMAHTALIM